MIDDIQLRQSVLNELHWDARFDATHIAVVAEQGTITLNGYVDNYPAIFMAREAVRRVNGVRAIADELRLQLSSANFRDDTAIAKSITHVLEHNVNSDTTDVKAEVSDGNVTLTGEVDWHHQRHHVEWLVSHVKGVKSISNCIELRRRLTPADVREQIESALTRNAELEAEHITISVEGDEVTLSGRVKAFYERNLVEAAVWHAPGVHKVIDKIKVG